MLTCVIAESKAAAKQAKEELSRKSKQLASSGEDGARPRAQLEELEAALASRDNKVAKLSRALTSQDLQVADLKRRFEEAEQADAAQHESSALVSDKLRLALSTNARKDRAIKELRARLDAADKDSAAQAAQISELTPLQSRLKQCQQESALVQKDAKNLAIASDHERDLVENISMHMETIGLRHALLPTLSRQRAPF